MEHTTLFQRLSAAIERGEKWEQEHRAYQARKDESAARLEARIARLSKQLDELKKIPKKERRGKWGPVAEELAKAKEKLRKLKTPWIERKSNFEAAKRKEREGFSPEYIKKLQKRSRNLHKRHPGK